MQTTGRRRQTMTRELAVSLAAGGCAFIISIFAWSYAISLLRSIYLDARQIARQDFRIENDHAQ
jgi:hypothetical protein